MEAHRHIFKQSNHIFYICKLKCDKISSEKTHTVQSVGFHVQKKIPQRHCAERERSRCAFSGMSGVGNGNQCLFFTFF